MKDSQELTKLIKEILNRFLLLRDFIQVPRLKFSQLGSFRFMQNHKP